MRIRLLIERNELPSVSVLWSFTPTQLTSTIAQFLENVNVRFPLEGNTWGLEDYTVTLGGYEAQHYTKVGEIFKEDDEVVIKPLLFAEARARTINGRAQITADGRRLVDGVPFGKPLLKRMRRPEVDIPPARKRARLVGQEEEDEEAVVRFEEVEDLVDDEDDDDDDEDFEDAGDDAALEEDDGDSEDDSEGDESVEVEEADWDNATEWRMPIRSIYSKQCCLRSIHLALVWDDDEECFSLIDGEDPVRLPGRDELATLSKRDVSISLTTVDSPDNHMAMFRGPPTDHSTGLVIIDFKNQKARALCLSRFMGATAASIFVSEKRMQAAFDKHRKPLMAAHYELRLQTGDDDNDEESDVSDSSSDSSESEISEEDAGTASDITSDDTSDSSDSDDSDDSSSSSEGDDQDIVGGGKEEKSDGSSSESSGSNTTWTGIDGSETAANPSEQESPLPIPHEGKIRTKERNVRRREAARLKHLKTAGEVPSTTTIKQMKQWIQTGEIPLPNSRPAEAQDAPTSKEQDAATIELERQRQKLISDINGGGVDISAEVRKSVAAAITLDMVPPQLKKSKKQYKAPIPLNKDDRPEEIPIGTEPVIVYTTNIASTPTVVDSTAENHAPHPAAAVKRHAETGDTEGSTSEGPKLVSAAHRLIYGSLGLKAPKTQSDKDALQRKLADRSRKSIEQIAAEEQVPEEEDPEAWRGRVVMSAVECLDEGVELSEPPFPFRQRWDPQYWSQNVKKRSSGVSGKAGNGKKRRRHAGGEVVETYDKYNQDGGGDALNYDDPVDENEEWEEEGWDDGENWQDGALLGADDEAENDGFPSLPDDTSTLAVLAETDAKVGDFVVFTEMACSDSTGWQPQMVTTVGCLDSSGNGDGGWNVRFSSRRGAKEYDDEGNRVYKKFEMEGYDDETEDDVREMAWAEMINVKLLLRPAVVGVTGDAGEEGEAAVAEQIQSQLEGEMGKDTSSADQ